MSRRNKRRVDEKTERWRLLHAIIFCILTSINIFVFKKKLYVFGFIFIFLAIYLIIYYIRSYKKMK